MVAAFTPLTGRGAGGGSAPGADLVGDDGEGTVDDVHLTDLGMLRRARALRPAVEEALDGPSRALASIDAGMAAEVDPAQAGAIRARRFNLKPEGVEVLPLTPAPGPARASKTSNEG